MEKISRKRLQELQNKTAAILPSDKIFELPEKVLQFGTGVLLRGLPDYFIDKANRQGIFNGRIVVVKSTDSGDSAAFDNQDNLYTLCINGMENQNLVEENILCSSISRVLSAKSQWRAILDCAKNPEMQIVISNTTEVGIQLFAEDKVHQQPPVSFPGKLLAFLYERFKCFNGSKAHGLVIVPTELIVNNAGKLKSIVLELANRNHLEEAFTEWLENANYFCNSLVDRIVPGKPAAEVQMKTEEALGYSDDLLISSEVYRLWAIEGNEQVKSVLSFQHADEGVIIEPDIELYRELKLRLLNGTHTLSCGLSFLSGFKTVKDGMQNEDLSAFISRLMLSELATSIPYNVETSKAIHFGQQVIDRFRNPYIEHHWLSITVQYTSKMAMRNIPSLLKYYKVHQHTPPYFAIGFAAYLLFMKAVSKEDGQYFGEFQNVKYKIQDDKAAYFYDKWNKLSVQQLVVTVLQDNTIWGSDLTTLPGFSQAVLENLDYMMKNGVFDKISAANKAINYQKY